MPEQKARASASEANSSGSGKRSVSSESRYSLKQGKTLYVGGAVDETLEGVEISHSAISHSAVDCEDVVEQVAQCCELAQLVQLD